MIAAAMLTELAGWVLLAVGMGLSFLYSGLETGAYVVNKIRVDLRAESGGRSARTLRRLLRNPRDMLSVLLIGNNLANYLASAGIVLLLVRRNWDHVDWYSAVIMTPVIFVFCELLPKAYFYRHGETLTYGLSWFLDASGRLFRATGMVATIRIMVAGILALSARRRTQAEGPLGRGHITGLIAEGHASGAITHAQSIMAERVVNIDRVRLADVMVPLGKAVLAPADATRGQLAELLAAHGHPRIGVYEGDRHNITGMLNICEVLLAGEDARPGERVSQPLRLGDYLGVTEALLQLQRRRKGIGFVTDGKGRCVGIVTAKDLVEEIVGELEEW